MVQKIPVGDGTFCYSGPACRKHAAAHTTLKQQLFMQLPSTSAAETATEETMKQFKLHMKTTSTVTLSNKVMTTSGETTLTPGVYDAAAQNVYGSGQCVSLAVAFARKMKLPHIQTAIRKDENRIIHAWVENPNDDETIYDYAGCTDLNSYMDFLDEEYGESGWEWKNVPLADAENISKQPYSNGLPEQNFQLASTMIDAILEKTSEQKSNYLFVQQPVGQIDN